MKKLLVLPIIICLLTIDQIGLGAYVNVGPTTDFQGDVGTTGVYKVNGSQISSDDLSDVASIAMLDEAKTITANWVNTAYPWADDEVSDDITIDNTTSITTTGSVTAGGTSLITFTPAGGTIATTANGDLTLDPNGSGNIVLSSAKLTSPATITRHYVVGACELGKNPTNPPAVDVYGITQVLEFTVDTDLAYYKLCIPEDYASGDLSIYIHWTRSATGSDESGKTVKWQLKYLAINGTSENCNSEESTLSVQDTYDSTSTTEQIVYKTDSMTIPAASFSAGDILILELGAITPTGTALSEPAMVAICIEYIADQVAQ